MGIIVGIFGQEEGKRRNTKPSPKAGAIPGLPKFRKQLYSIRENAMYSLSVRPEFLLKRLWSEDSGSDGIIPHRKPGRINSGEVFGALSEISWSIWSFPDSGFAGKAYKAHAKASANGVLPLRAAGGNPMCHRVGVPVCRTCRWSARGMQRVGGEWTHVPARRKEVFLCRSIPEWTWCAPWGGMLLYRNSHRNL